MNLVAQGAGYAILPLMLAGIVDLYLGTSLSPYFATAGVKLAVVTIGLYAFIGVGILTNDLKRTKAGASRSPLGIEIDLFFAHRMLGFVISCVVLGTLQSLMVRDHTLLDRSLTLGSYVFTIFAITFIARWLFQNDKLQMRRDTAAFLLFGWGTGCIAFAYFS